MPRKLPTRPTDEEIVNACENSFSMREAAESLKFSFTSFKRHAIRLGVYKTHQGAGQEQRRRRTGKKQLRNKCRTNVFEILEGKHPKFQTNRLKQYLLQESVFEHRCMKCGLIEWMGEKIPLELHHRSGNRYDHRKENLQLLCPNCHAQTSTYCGKNIGKYD